MPDRTARAHDRPRSGDPDPLLQGLAPAGQPAAEPPVGTDEPEPAGAVARSGPGNVSVVQVIGSALAAVSAAVVSSSFGVAGTVIGAALASVIATVGSAVYSASLRRTNDRLRELALTRRAAGGGSAAHPLPLPLPLPKDSLARSLSVLRRRWKAIAGVTALVFALAIGAITVIEAATRQPVSSLVGGGSSTGTSVGSLIGGSSSAHQPVQTPAVTPTPTPSPTSTASSVPTQHTTPSPTPKPTASPTRSASPGAGSASPTVGATPEATPSAQVAVTPSP